MKRFRHIQKNTFEDAHGIQKTCYFDAERQTEYRRIVGGVAWPVRNKDGFVIVVAEDFHKDARLDTRHIRILDEAHAKMDQIVRTMYDFQNFYSLNPWYGNPDNPLSIHFVDQFNFNLPRGKVGVSVARAPFGNDAHNLRVYAHLLRSNLTANRNILHFQQGSVLPSILPELQPDDIQTKTAEEFPEVAALGYALMSINEPYSDINDDQRAIDAYLSLRMVDGL